MRQFIQGKGGWPRRAKTDVVRLSARDTQRVIELLERPPQANARLRAAAKALPRQL